MNKVIRCIAILLVAMFIFPTDRVCAQVPQAIPYQGVARDANGNLLANQNISLQFTIQSNILLPVIFYQETHSVTTSSLGLFSVNIGEGIPITGTFASIDWGSTVYGKFLKVEMDATGGANYIDMGTTAMLSVPYALFSGNSGNGLSPGSTAGNTLHWNGVTWVNDSNIYNNGGSIGIGTNSPGGNLHINGGENVLMKMTGNGTGMGSFDGLQIGLNSSSPYIMNQEASDLIIGTSGTERMRITADGKVGIDTYTPDAKFTLDNDGGIVAKGLYNTGADLTTTGIGTRMIWYPKKAAFRAGLLTSGQETFWDNDSIGGYSFAVGSGTRATGLGSFAAGHAAKAVADYTFAYGFNARALAPHAIAFGNNALASGGGAVALQSNSTASGTGAVSMGSNTIASGDFSFAVGANSTASGISSFIIGIGSVASGDYSTAMGTRASTNSKLGAFSVGDFSTLTFMNSTSDNEFSSRFAGGYRFFSDAATTTANGMFFANGNLGIGTNIPASKLEVAGTTTTTNFKMTNGAVSNYLLQSDASGNATWVSPSAIAAVETDPQVNSTNTNYLSKWNGSALIDGSVYDNGMIGIGTANPEFKLTLDTDGGIMSKGNFGTGTSLTTSGAGTRMMWYARKAAFRAGYAILNEWDNNNIGDYSFAGNRGNKASAFCTTAFGNTTQATQDDAFASGYASIASGFSSVAMGDNVHASGSLSTAFGSFTTASGTASTAFGFTTTASGENSLAAGFYAYTAGENSFALGQQLTADANNSVALGSVVSTNGHTGSFVFGDASTLPTLTDLNATADNSFNARFTGGYKLYTDATTTTPNGLFFTGGKLGVGSSVPEFKLSLDVDGGILAKGTLGAGSPLATAGAGTRMMWYPKKAAFRTGTVSGNAWNDANIGNYSFAVGNNTTASNSYSVALGNQATASGYNSLAAGVLTTASGDYAIALGNGTLASGASSTTLGNTTIASGDFSTAMGAFTTASGNYSTAIGNSVSTNGHEGALIIGDNSTTTVMSSQSDNGFRARFAGGYRFFTDAALSAGVFLSSGGGSWTSISDRNKKENFIPVNEEDILLKVSALSMCNWNYKAQSKDIRHVGCMAQDFYAAFHLDGQSDTTINSLDIDGINMAAIQALKKRTDELKIATDKIEALLSDMAILKEQVEALISEKNKMNNSSALIEK